MKSFYTPYSVFELTREYSVYQGLTGLSDMLRSACLVSVLLMAALPAVSLAQPAKDGVSGDRPVVSEGRDNRLNDTYHRWDGPSMQDLRKPEPDSVRAAAYTRTSAYRWHRYDLCGCGRYSYYRVYTADHHSDAPPQMSDHQP